MKRKLLFLCLILFIPRPSYASWALVGSLSAKSLGANGGTSNSLNTTGGDFLIAAVSTEANVTASISADTYSNTWHQLSSVDLTNLHVQLFYAWNASVGSGHTVTVAGTGSFAGIVWGAFSGSQTSSDPIDKQDFGAVVVSTTAVTPSVTPVSNNEIVFTGLLFNVSDTISISSPFVTPTTQDFVGGTSYGCSLSYVIQTTATAAQATWTRGSSQNMQTNIATFKAGAGGGGAANKSPLLMLDVGK